MSIDFKVVMIGSAPSPAAAVTRVLNAVGTLGLTLGSSLYSEVGDDDVESDPDDPGWEETVNRWPWIGFGLHQPGPGLTVVLEPIRDRVLQASLNTTMGLLGSHYQQGSLERVYYAPLFQIAQAVEARAGIGDPNLEAELWSEEDVLREIGFALGSETQASLGFVLRDPGVPKPGGPFVVTERPEGYWLLEHPWYFDCLRR